MPTEFSIGLQIYIYILVFLFGACLASFITCAADRYVLKQSVLKGRSYCPACGHKLGILDLFPIFSFIFLRGKCRYCGAKIPARCLICELLGGAVYVLILLKFGFSFQSLELALLVPALLGISLIDYDSFEIPNGLVIYCAVLFAAFVASYADPLKRLIYGLIGGAAFGVGTLIIALIMDKVLKRDSLGGGDIKLLGAVGLFTGPWRGLFMLILACIIGLVFGLITKKKSNGQFPFGPAICIATYIALLVGQDVIDLYLSLFV